MLTLSDLIQAIAPVEAALAAQVQQALDRKTKPSRSLGRLEDLACRYAAARGERVPEMPCKAMVVMAADHGVVVEKVSAYPQEVTAQMLLNFANGGAAINVLARLAGAELVVVDMGVKTSVSAAGVVADGRVAAGTANMVEAPAMTREQALQAIGYGAALAHRLADRGITLVGMGEMGIGNTTSASAIVALLTDQPANGVTGRGTGVDDGALANKIAVVERAVTRHRDARGNALDVLTCVGGFEIAGLVGLALGAASRRVPIVVDGFITAAAALIAARLAPAVEGYLLASHASVEPGHRHVMEALGQRPLVDLQMRLGEGSGAALTMGLVDASVAILRDMATFEAAGVSTSDASA